MLSRNKFQSWWQVELVSSELVAVVASELEAAADLERGLAGAVSG